MVGARDRQLAVLAAIRASIVRFGYPPTTRELCSSLGIRSTNGVNDHVDRLVAKGLLTVEYATARGMRLTPKGEEVLGERAPAAKVSTVDLVEVHVFSNLVPGCEVQEPPLRLSKNMLHGARDPFGYKLCAGGSGFLAGDVLLAGEVEDPRGIRPVIALVSGMTLACQVSINHLDKAVVFRPLIGGTPVYALLNAFDPSAVLGTVVGLWRTTD